MRTLRREGRDMRERPFHNPSCSGHEQRVHTAQEPGQCWGPGGRCLTSLTSLHVCHVRGRHTLDLLTMWKSLRPRVPGAKDIRARASWIAPHTSPQGGRALTRGSPLARHERTHPSEERRHDTHGANNCRAVLTSVHSKTTGEAL